MGRTGCESDAAPSGWSKRQVFDFLGDSDGERFRGAQPQRVALQAQERNESRDGLIGIEEGCP
jgi:hypothetical protein